MTYILEVIHASETLQCFQTDAPASKFRNQRYYWLRKEMLLTLNNNKVCVTKVVFSGCLFIAHLKHKTAYPVLNPQ